FRSVLRDHQTSSRLNLPSELAVACRQVIQSRDVSIASAAFKPPARIVERKKHKQSPHQAKDGAIIVTTALIKNSTGEVTSIPAGQLDSVSGKIGSPKRNRSWAAIISSVCHSVRSVPSKIP